ncbi:MAG: GGDEF domain-containing protein [Acidobacteria bacterium]|nr:GGDEF domain-containing protein [Acidobacteriota bacterium]
MPATPVPTRDSDPRAVRREPMPPARGQREVLATALPIGGGLLALALLAQWGGGLPGFGLPGQGGLAAWILFAVAVTLCLLHRPFDGSTLGVAAVVLPAALLEQGGVGAALAAAVASLAADSIRRRLRRHSPFVGPERRRIVRSLETAGTLTLAILAGALAGALVRNVSEVERLAVAGAVYVLVLAGLRLLDKKLRRPFRAIPWAASLLPLATDGLAWAAGVAVAVVAARVGWTIAAVLLAAFALLALETGRNALRHGMSEQRVSDLERLSRASRRIAGDGRERGLVSVAERIRIECSNVLHFQWFQFELLARDATYQSWWAGPDRRLHEGRPEPPPSPPPLPGIHRRSHWQRVERSLETEDQLIGRLTLWCDPRQLEADSLDHLDSLMPQMVASLQRALLDREAKVDPLTGLALRRVLEERLDRAYRRSVQEGTPMAVVMCDLDHFKKINDTYGHATGDQALSATAALLAAETGDDHLAARYGGEEFTLLLEEADGDEALALAERIRAAVEALDVVVDGQRIPLTLSLGVAVFPQLHVKRPQELVELADEALYEAKGHGRNRALLHLGRGRFRTAAGGTVSGQGDSKPVEPPHIFA